MKNYIIIKNNTVVRMGSCQNYSDIDLAPDEQIHFTDGTFLVGDKVYILAGDIKND